MNTKLISVSLISALTLSACAQGADKIEASYVSPTTFTGRSCNQLMSERNEIVSTVNQLSADQYKSAKNDAVATGVALLLFWPAAFALAATEDNSTALSAAKGNYDAITKKMTQQGCEVPADSIT